MAAGDFIVFDSFLEAIGDGNVPDLNAEDIYMAICTNATVPAVDTADPQYGAGGSTNFASTDITTGGNYTTGGTQQELTTTITTPWTISGSTTKFDLDDVEILQGANPDTGYWGLIYTDTDKRCLGFVELGSPVLLSAGNFTITWNAAGLFTINNPA
jgi:hypothetical protein